MNAHAQTSRAKLPWRTLFWSAAAILVVVVLVLAWLPDPVAVDVAQAQRGKLAVTVREDGRTRVKDRFLVSAPVMGNLSRMELRAGDRVEEGAIVARLVPLASPLLDARSRAEADARLSTALAAQQQAEAAVSRMQVAHDYATKELEHQRTLAKKGASAEKIVERAEMEVRATAEELASARFGASVAAHQVEMARVILRRADAGERGRTEQLELRAPVAGVVLRVLQESEGVVQPGLPLVELGDAKALEVVVDVLTSDASRIQPGARVTIDRWGGEATLSGHVRVVEPSAFTRVSALGVEEQRVNVLIELTTPYETWRALGDGYRVEATITLLEVADALLVPEMAVFRDREKWAVYVVRDGRAQLVHVGVGQRNGHAVEITQGLKAGDTVIVHPGEKIVAGVRVVAR